MTILRMHYAVAADGEVSAVDERHELRLFAKDEYVRAFSDAGLEVTWDPQGLTGRGLLIAVHPEAEAAQPL